LQVATCVTNTKDNLDAGRNAF